MVLPMVDKKWRARSVGRPVPPVDFVMQNRNIRIIICMKPEVNSCVSRKFPENLLLPRASTPIGGRETQCAVLRFPGWLWYRFKGRVGVPPKTIAYSA